MRASRPYMPLLCFAFFFFPRDDRSALPVFAHSCLGGEKCCTALQPMHENLDKVSKQTLTLWQRVRINMSENDSSVIWTTN